MMHVIDAYCFRCNRTVRNKMAFFIKCLFTFTCKFILGPNLASSIAARSIATQTSTFTGKNEIHFKSAQLSILCLEGFNDLSGLSGTQEPREGVLGHQIEDPPLRGFESVGTHRVHHTQQSLAGFCIQVYLRAKVSLHRSCRAFVHFCLCTNLLRCVRVDELAADAAGLGLGRSILVVLAGQPEPQVLLTVFGPQELLEGLKTT